MATQAVLAPPNVEPYLRQLDQLRSPAMFDDDARAILRATADRYRGL